VVVCAQGKMQNSGGRKWDEDVVREGMEAGVGALYEARGMDCRSGIGINSWHGEWARKESGGGEGRVTGNCGDGNQPADAFEWKEGVGGGDGATGGW
jgi:hypothetical protein